MRVKKGSSYLGHPANTSIGRKRHLSIIITDPNPDGFVLVVPVTTYNQNLKQETHLILRQGEHPFIIRDSVLAYNRIEITVFQSIQSLIQSGIFIQKDDIAPQLLKRIQQAVTQSNRITKQIQTYFEYF